MATINLHARTDFKKGDAGRVSGHIVARVDGPKQGERLAVALQDIKAGENGWFDVNAA